MIRVKAINELGGGPWSALSKIGSKDGPTKFAPADLRTILASTIPTSMLFFTVLFTCLILG